jgi:hypothetical protein
LPLFSDGVPTQIRAISAFLRAAEREACGAEAASGDVGLDDFREAGLEKWRDAGEYAADFMIVTVYTGDGVSETT